MADEVLYAGVANQRVAEALSTDYIMLAADRAALPNHPALFYAGDLFGTGTDTKKVAHADIMGRDLPVPVADGAKVGNTVWGTGATTVVVARRSKAYAASDLAKWTDSLGLLNAGMLAQDAFMSHNLAKTEAIAALMGGFSNKVGATGVDLSLANVLAALTLLEVGFEGGLAEGDAMGVLHTVQGGDFRTALATATGGAVQWQVPPEQLVLKGNGYRGRYLGADWFASGRVPTANAGADRAGGLFVKGALIWCDMSVAAEGAEQLNIGGKVLFERARDGYGATTGYPSHSYSGFAEGIDAFGVTIETDA